MRKLIFLMIALFIAAMGFAQKETGRVKRGPIVLKKAANQINYSKGNTRAAILSEDFEGSGLPAGWTTIDADGDGYCWETLAETNQSFAEGYGNNSDGAMVSWSYYPTSQTSQGWSGESLNTNDYLITPQITVPAGNSKLVFYIASFNGSSYPDDIEVKISTTGRAQSDFTTLMANETVTASVPNFVERNVSLNAYAGQQVYIAFVHQSSDMWGIVLDDVSVMEITPYDIAVSGVEFTENSGCGLTTTNAVVTLTNNGSSAITAFTLAYTINGGSPVSANVTANITAGATYQYTFENIDISSEGEYSIVVTATLVGDGNTADNTKSAAIAHLAPATIPYNNAFDTDEDLAGLSLINANNDNVAFSLYYVDAPEDLWPGIQTYNASNGNDDYFVTSCITIAAGTYILSVDVMAGYASYGYTDDFSIVYGTAPTAEALTNVIYNATDYAGEETLVQQFTVAADGTYYFAFRVTSASGAQFLINNLSIIVPPTTPEIELTSVLPASGATVQTEQEFNISGVVTNNGTTLNSYRVSYSVDGGAAVVYNVSGINVAMGGTHSFTHATPVVLSTAGTHTIVVTVSNPNGAADGDASDNSMTITLNAVSCDPITTFPYTEDFENGLSLCWTIIDADGDGYNWRNSSEAMAEGYGHNSSVNAIVSASYANSTALNPDNWAISPAITLPANHYVELSFFAAVQDASYSAEHYGVYVSTTTTNPSAFSLIWEETMDADGGSHSKVQGTWREKHADLSNYAGQTIYIAFRHFNCTDQYYMLIDDININTTLINQYTITAISANDNMGTVTGGGTYNEGSSVVLRATANAGYHFVRWNDGNTSNPRTITVTGNATYTAYFEETLAEYIIDVYSSNSNYGYAWGGGTYTEGSTITIGAEPYEGYRFTSWNDGNTSSSRTITVTGNATYIASFEEIPYYTITVVASNPNYGYACCGGTYQYGTEITIEAEPYPGYRFVGWNGGSTENPRRITVTEDATYTAYFEEIVEYTITVVSSNPNYGYACCSGTYAAGTEITIEAMAYPGYEFVGWGGGNTENPCTITVTGDATYTAFFREIEAYTIVVNAVESYMGTVSGGGVYEVGSEVMIEAIPYNGYVFTRWDDGNVNNPRRIIVNGDATYTAIFADINTVTTHTITVFSSNPNYGSVAGGGTYAEGTRVLISASANNGYMFTQWSDGNTDNPRWVTVIADATYIATFVRGDAVDETSISDISLYPNPASDILNITSSEEISEIEIVNVMGQVVFRMEVNSDNAVCDVNGLANGTYIVRIHTANAETFCHRKFVKE